MKRRLIKKWISRYLKPQLEGLPKIESYAVDIILGREVVYERESHVFIDGYGRGEGERARLGHTGWLNFKRQGEAIQRVKEAHQHVYVRIPHRTRGKHVYTRLVTE